MDLASHGRHEGHHVKYFLFLLFCLLNKNGVFFFFFFFEKNGVFFGGETEMIMRGSSDEGIGEVVEYSTFVSLGGKKKIVSKINFNSKLKIGENVT